MKDKVEQMTKIEKFSYSLAYIFVGVLFICFTSAFVAATIKFITWLF